jgi:hypothetical protein
MDLGLDFSLRGNSTCSRFFDTCGNDRGKKRRPKPLIQKGIVLRINALHQRPFDSKAKKGQNTPGQFKFLTECPDPKLSCRESLTKNHDTPDNELTSHSCEPLKRAATALDILTASALRICTPPIASQALAQPGSVEDVTYLRPYLASS